MSRVGSLVASATGSVAALQNEVRRQLKAAGYHHGRMHVNVRPHGVVVVLLGDDRTTVLSYLEESDEWSCLGRVGSLAEVLPPGVEA